MRSLLVVTVNYRVGQLCIQALAALEPELAGRPDCRAVVVDNASGDGSDEMIEAAIRARGWQEWARLVRSPVNGGFAAGNNLALGAALSGPQPPLAVLLLNPDTIVRPGAVAALWRRLEQEPRAGIVGSRLEDEDGTQQRSCFRFPGMLSEIDAHLALGALSRMLSARVVAPPPPQSSCRVDWVSGASMMVRREVFEQIGLLDEDFFMYFEELDFTLRARRRGWECWYEHDSRVVHLVGKSSQVDEAKARTRPLPGYWYRSRRRFWVKRSGLAYALLIDAVALSCHALRGLRFALQRKPQAWHSGYARGVLRLGCSRGRRR